MGFLQDVLLFISLPQILGANHAPGACGRNPGSAYHASPTDLVRAESHWADEVVSAESGKADGAPKNYQELSPVLSECGTHTTPSHA